MYSASDQPYSATSVYSRRSDCRPHLSLWTAGSGYNSFRCLQPSLHTLPVRPLNSCLYPVRSQNGSHQNQIPLVHFPKFPRRICLKVRTDLHNKPAFPVRYRYHKHRYYGSNDNPLHRRNSYRNVRSPLKYQAVHVNRSVRSSIAPADLTYPRFPYR